MYKSRIHIAQSDLTSFHWGVKIKSNPRPTYTEELHGPRSMFRVCWKVSFGSQIVLSLAVTFSKPIFLLTTDNNIHIHDHLLLQGYIIRQRQGLTSLNFPTKEKNVWMDYRNQWRHQVFVRRVCMSCPTLIIRNSQKACVCCLTPKNSTPAMRRQPVNIPDSQVMD